MTQEKQKRSRGGQPKDPMERRSGVVTFRIREQLKQELETSSRHHGRTVSEEIAHRLEQSLSENDRLNRLMNEVVWRAMEVIKANKQKIDLDLTIALVDSISQAEREIRGANSQTLDKDLPKFISGLYRATPDPSTAPSWVNEGDGVARPRTHNPPPDRQGRPAPADGGPELPPAPATMAVVDLDALAERAAEKAIERMFARLLHSNEGLEVLDRNSPAGIEAEEKRQQQFEAFTRRRSEQSKAEGSPEPLAAPLVGTAEQQAAWAPITGPTPNPDTPAPDGRQATGRRKKTPAE